MKAQLRPGMHEHPDAQCQDDGGDDQPKYALGNPAENPLPHQRSDNNTNCCHRHEPPSGGDRMELGCRVNRHTEDVDQ